jgi:Uma2 family endonuclease
MEGHGPARAYRGPDAFWVGGVEADRRRQVWIAWEENGKLPDVIIELLHPWTAHKDRTEKRDLYERVFGTAEYFLYDPETRELEGLRLAEGTYRPIMPADNGRLWSEQLGVFLGLWHGVVERRDDDWVRLFRSDGSLIPIEAEAAWQRAEAAEAENARLRALLKEHGPG